MTGIWIRIQKIGINFNMKFSGSKYVNNMNDWCWSNWPFHKRRRRQRRRRVFNLQHVFNVLHCYCYLVKPLSGCDAKIYARAHTQSFKWTRQWRVCKMRVRVFMWYRRMAKVQMSCSDCRWYIRNPLVVFSLSLCVSFRLILFCLFYNIIEVEMIKRDSQQRTRTKGSDEMSQKLSNCRTINITLRRGS